MSKTSNDRSDTGIFASIKAEIRNLPRQVQERIWQIIIDHADTRAEPDGDLPLYYGRVSVRHERRGNGSPYWRLYIESGSRTEGTFRRVRRYIGTAGGAETMEIIQALRQHYFTILGKPLGLRPCDSHRELFRQTKAQLQWELRHVYDRNGRRNPDSLALLMGYASEPDYQ